MPKWITFILIEEGDKTNIWNVATKDKTAILGQIRWFPRWRKYGFFPNEDTVFEDICLRDIATFIEEKMYERKMRKL